MLMAFPFGPFTMPIVSVIVPNISNYSTVIAVRLKTLPSAQVAIVNTLRMSCSGLEHFIIRSCTDHEMNQVCS